MKIILLVISMFFSTNLLAHEFSTASLTITENSEDTYQGDLEVSISDLQQVLQFDPNNDGEITWGELQQSHPQFIDFFDKTLLITSTTESCSIQWNNHVSLVDTYGEVKLKQPLNFECSGNLTVNYNAFFGTTNNHKLLINWLSDNQQYQTIIDAPNQAWEIEKASSSAWETFSFYLYQGMIHIWIGLDHVLFLIALLLHVFWHREDSTKHSTLTQQLQIRSLLWLVTGFTIAHSITLTLTALDWINVSSKWAEVGIAVSVAYSAINVLTGWIRKIMVMTVAFGLLHGMGFAGALSELGLSKSHQLVSIIGFNLGVEIGQVAIVLVTVPVFWLINRYKMSRNILIPLSSISICLLGSYWVWQRI